MAPLGPCGLLRCAPRFPRWSGPTPGLPPRARAKRGPGPGRAGGTAQGSARPPAGGQSRGGKRRRGPAHLERGRPGTQPPPAPQRPRGPPGPPRRLAPGPAPRGRRSLHRELGGPAKVVSESRPGRGGLGVALPSGSICSRRRAPALPEPLRAELGRAVTKEAAVRGGWVSSPSHCSCIAP